MDLDPTSPIPLYHQLKTHILDRVHSGEFLPGAKIPTEHEICESYGVSRTTARQALTELADEGVIIRARRRGSMVAPGWRSTPENTKLRMVISDSARAERIENSIDGSVNIGIDVVPYDEIHEYLMRAVSEGDAPDIALIDHVWVAEFASSHMIYPLDELNPEWISSLVTNDIHDSIASGYRFEGSMYAVPEEVNLAGIWYDTEVLAAVSAEIPRTWDDLIETAGRIKSSGLAEYPISMPGGVRAQETTTYCLAAILASNDSNIITDTVRLDTPEGVAAMRLIRQLVVDGLLDPEAISNDWLAGPRALVKGSAAINVGGSYESEHIAASINVPRSAIGDRYAFAPFPGGPSGDPATVIGGMAHVVFRQSKDPLRSMDLIEAIMTPDALESRAVDHWTIPPLQSVIRSSSPESPFVTETLSMLPHARTRPIVPGYQAVTRQLQRMLQSVISGSMRPAAAVERTAEFIGAMTNLPVDRG
jgi:multiple sugar transport system substrate-binding protein